jgi:hypothetical protein
MQHELREFGEVQNFRFGAHIQASDGEAGMLVRRESSKQPQPVHALQSKLVVARGGEVHEPVPHLGWQFRRSGIAIPPLGHCTCLPTARLRLLTSVGGARGGDLAQALRLAARRVLGNGHCPLHLALLGLQLGQTQRIESREHGVHPLV